MEYPIKVFDFSTYFFYLRIQASPSWALMNTVQAFIASWLYPKLCRREHELKGMEQWSSWHGVGVSLLNQLLVILDKDLGVGLCMSVSKERLTNKFVSSFLWWDAAWDAVSLKQFIIHNIWWWTEPQPSKGYPGESNFKCKWYHGTRDWRKLWRTFDLRVMSEDR